MNNKLKLLILSLCLILNYSNSNVNASRNNDMYYNGVTNNDDVFNRRIDILNYLIQKVNYELIVNDEIDQENIEFVLNKLEWLKSGLEDAHMDGFDPTGAIKSCIGMVMPVISTMLSQDEYDMWQFALNSML